VIKRTILGENQPGSLQVHARSGEWIDVFIPPQSFVINIGGLMMRWTNDRWVSTLHRVVNPPESIAAKARRMSPVFFHYPNYDAEWPAFRHAPSRKSAALSPGESRTYRSEKFAQANIASIAS